MHLPRRDISTTDTDSRAEPQQDERVGGSDGAALGRHHGHTKYSQSFLFSPNEIAIVGVADADKTALTNALLRELGTRHRIAYLDVDHDPGETTVARGDTPPSGTAEIAVADGGASSVYRAGTSRYTLLGEGSVDRWNGYDLWNEADLVLVDGHRETRLPAIVAVDREGSIFERIEAGEPETVLAFVLPEDPAPRVRELARGRAGDLPLFEAREAGAVADFVEKILERRTRSVPLYGLVLGGGKSTRMKRDKAAIDYRGVPQVRHAYALLEGFCDRVFVSNRAEQESDPVFRGLEQIHDRFLDIGPMGGILSALHTHPDAAWLVVGCDLPFLDEATLSELVAQRDPLMLATCYESAHDGLPEPLCAIYEPRYRRRLHQFLADGRDCPRKALINSRAKRLTLTNPRALDNINYPEEYDQALALIRGEQIGGE